MKMRKMFKTLTALLLTVSLTAMGVGCDKFSKKKTNTTTQTYYEQDFSDSVYESDYVITDVSSLAAQDHIKYTVMESLEEEYPDYNVDYVDSRYISQEYIDEMSYNSLKNVYFGYDYDEIESYMQGTKWTFTVDENGQTVVTEVQKQSNAVVDMIKKVAIGTGVIVVCAVLTYATAGAATPIACFFAGAAKGALIGAVSGAAISGVVGGTIAGIQTKSWEGALEGAAAAAADGYMWGAISGALLGGFKSTACFVGDTLVKTDNGHKEISEIAVGDMVYSFNEQTNDYEYQPVSQVMKKTANDIVTISVGGEEITTTSTHPFYTPDGWVKAAELSRESLLLTNDGYVQIEAIEYESEDLWVYNLNVPYTHTYTVSEQDVVVHNACGDSAKLRQNLLEAGDVVPEYPNAAHHIVPSSDARFAQAAQARDKLLSLGIEINDAGNGVFLSTSKNVLGTTYHRTIHTAAYYEKVNSMLSTATTKAQALEVLGEIKTMLLNGTFLP